MNSSLLTLVFYSVNDYGWVDDSAISFESDMEMWAGGATT